jgi:hypothetical protein
LPNPVHEAQSADSTLQINTLGHALGALIMYMFWWHKPLDIERPTIISTESHPAADNVLAYLHMTTKRLPVTYRMAYSEMPEAADMHWVSTWHTAEQNLDAATRSPNFERTSVLAAWRRRVTTWVKPWFTESPEYNSIGLDEWYVERPRPRPCAGVGEESPVTVSIVDLLARRQHTRLPHDVELQPTGLSCKHDVELSKSDTLRWVLAMALLKETDPKNLEAQSSADSWNRVADRASDLPPLDLDPNHLDWTLLLAFNISSMLYGGLHAIAWNAHFASGHRRALWHLSSAGVMGFFAISTLILYVERKLFHKPKAVNVALKATHFVLYRIELAGTLFFAGLLTFLAARTYLLVECYISLTDLPKEAYNVPQWSAFVPHI